MENLILRFSTGLASSSDSEQTPIAASRVEQSAFEYHTVKSLQYTKSDSTGKLLRSSTGRRKFPLGVDVESQFFVSLDIVSVQLLQSINASLDMRFRVMFRWLFLVGAIIGVLQIGGGHHQVASQQSKAMSSHLLQHKTNEEKA